EPYLIERRFTYGAARIVGGSVSDVHGRRERGRLHLVREGGCRGWRRWDPESPIRHARAGGNRVENGRPHSRRAVITGARRRDSTERWPAPDWARRSRHKGGNRSPTHRTHTRPATYQRQYARRASQYTD